MFKKILVPVDLAHFDVIEPSLQVVADQAKFYDAEVCYVAVAANTPGAVARTPEEHQQKLDAFAQERAEVHGQPVSTRLIICPDPIADLDDRLIDAIDESGADLVIMPTHPPKHLDVVIPSHGGKVATHTRASVFLVRPPRD
ncbi:MULTISPECIES: universal stress protein [Modicisalibacter]|uniref:Universal stress protein n=1 Tax=Modicisalibacter tunisiensis TaxID=390637 RepID=A0ABS7X347_9GAMM|nr:MULTISPECIES: universal stress protein [Modicisalibacter]MBZ9537552.1 universal stress protein [Modicisalibacter tunisiensis]MBZ9569025.1 universal stress protein [Modicisalibacter tunisiensis]